LNDTVKDSIFCHPVNRDEMLKIISKLKNNTSPGPDNLTPN